MKRLPYTKSPKEAYELRVVRTDGCWGWIGYTNAGYPMLGPRKMHRWALEQKLGRNLTSEEQCRHLCGNKSCTNPDHLSVGTQADNEADKQAHFDGKLGNSDRYKLTAEDAETIRKLKGKMLQREIAQMFSITQVMVSRIQTGKAWNEHHSLQRTVQD